MATPRERIAEIARRYRIREVSQQRGSLDDIAKAVDADLTVMQKELRDKDDDPTED